ncbi:hypothetical protein GGR21_003881 [Dysgonomonas hofstadii]|uniref:Glycosyltransferase RgtA/B/C/D-like domain-containing protein n=1 Tax=Dysgonomonas hofstadii TaxID=637886 RepID=A0A840CPD4_9BACT|nr:glycosyltransferase family 39 protein [Dysgonomonas hofstadii]MBB4037957.1 hypothetical protein [Dysgonomonas hofstadii]
MSHPIIRNKASKEDKIIYSLLFLFALLVCFFNTKNSPFYLFNDWCDPNIYFSIGKGVFNGKIPYKDLFDHKGPLIFLIYGIGYLISNMTLSGIFLIQVCLWTVSMIYAYKLSMLFLDRTFSFTIALLYSTLLYSKSGTGGSADEFIVPAITISFYYFITFFVSQYKEDHLRHKIMLIQGICFGVAFFIKFSVAVFWIPLLLSIYYQSYSAKKYKEMAYDVLYFLGGFMVLCVPICLYFAVNGAFDDFIFAYFRFNSMYANTGFDFDVLMNIVARTIKLVLGFYIAFPLVLFGLGMLLFSRKYIKEKAPRMGIFFAFVLLYLPMVNSVNHNLYAYINLYIFALMGLIILVSILAKYIKIKYRYTLGALAIVVVLLLNIYNQGFLLYSPNMLNADKSKVWQNQFAEIINKEPAPTLLDLGLDKGVYTAANLVPAYKYFFHPLIDDRLFPEIRKSHEELIKNKEPFFVISSGFSFPYLEENYEVISEYVESEHSSIFLFKKK